ncbi:Abi family protein [uncultured Kocuria sp.]|uniref:Abi family protein n=1 Tax=uncultured Kocuria sp. TaxID=259305 RepID=UPI002595F75D|nr:Abi family protein [uncultured Kocuria sp.]MCT1367190.1 Abi family protein [Rothia sp. p3-SID1597]
MSKSWVSYEDQVTLLEQRGMRIDDAEAAAVFLSKVSYYRLSGYFRHWQQDPQLGDNRFTEGASFDALCALYDAEQKIVATCNDLLHGLEVLLRTRFAHAYGNTVGVTGTFARGKGFTQSPKPSQERVEEHSLRDLGRSKEAFIAHYRDEIKQGHVYKPEAYARMPIWVAVEAFSFGSLSRLIQASGQSGVLDQVADSLSTSRKLLPSQVRSFVYLRNRIAHCAQLWNHFVLDVPGLQPKKTRYVQQRHRSFTDHSIYKILVALDDIASRSGLRSEWLKQVVEPILNDHPLLARGIATPCKFGEMPKDLFRSA